MLLLAGGLSAVFALPKQLFFQPVGVSMELPETVGNWFGRTIEVSELERQVLGKETEFARKTYENISTGDEVQVSIVLAGQDMNTGIHRPERCLPAQGWTIANKSSVLVPLEGRPPQPATRLYDLKTLSSAEGKPGLIVYNLQYYWFAGHTDVTSSHYERTYIDMRDRLIGGYNQRWAYVTVAATITQNLRKFGRNEEQTDRIIQDFIKEIVPLVDRRAKG